MKLVHHERLENALKNLKVKLSTLGASLQKYLLTGVIAIVPTAVTLYIIYYIFKFTDSFLGNTLSEALGFSLPGMGIFVTALICLLVGFLAQYYFGQKIISGLDNSLNNIPVVKSVYSSIKQVADVFINNSKDNFKRVVMLEFPKENSWAIGFVSSDFLLKVDADIPEKDAMITVFVPTTPNPTSGYLIIVPKTKVIDLDISIEDAMKIIVSGGLVQPVKAVETDETAKLEDSKIPEGTKLLEEEKERINFDHPDAIEWPLLIKHIEDLRAGKAIEMPTYSYVTCGRGKETIPVSPCDVLIVEGILVFTDRALCDILDLKVFVDTDADERLIRIIQRDVNERGRGLDKSIVHYQNFVKPMHELFIEPSKRLSDIIIPVGGENEKGIDILTSKIKQTLGII